jgi:outer membrane murein-binding lipoprotein Lpp
MIYAANFSRIQHLLGRALVLGTFVLSAAMLAGCVASAKVYQNDKTVVYNGATYNLANVKQIKSKISGKLSDTNTVDLINADKKQIESYLKEYNTIYVRMAFEFDDQEMLYRASSVSKYSDYSKMKKSFDNAGDQINNLMADKKKLQIKLK